MNTYVRRARVKQIPVKDRLVCCVKQVGKLLARPIVGLLNDRMGGTRAYMIPKNTQLELFTTTRRQRQSRDSRYLCTHSRSKKGLSETGRPGLILVMRSVQVENVLENRITPK
jgi:hypothetical protein